MTEQTLEIPIQGMHCAGCASTIEKAIQPLPGVRSASVNFATERASVRVDSDRFRMSALDQAMTGAGYRIKTQEQTFAIEGMTCSSCITRIEDVLRRTPGVLEVSLNFGTETGWIRFAEGASPLQSAQVALRSMGYTLRPEKTGLKTSAELEKREMLEKLIFSAVASSILMIFSMQGMLFDRPLVSPRTAQWIMLLLALPVQYWAGWHFHTGFLRALKNRSADMNTLISVGTNAAFLYSAVLMFLPHASHETHPALYFDTAAMIITLILVGKFLESRAKVQTHSAVQNLLASVPATVRVLRNGSEVEIDVSQVAAGDDMIVRPGERIGADGTIADGLSSVNESMITGESLPREKQSGDAVLTGTINLDGALRVRVDRIGGDTVLSQIVRLIEKAQGTKPSIQRFADRFAALFVPAVIATAGLTFLFWYFAASNPSAALMNSIAVLIIACPCAMGLATPTAVMVAIGAGASRGLLIKRADLLEQATRMNMVVFDKTGTLTTGRLYVSKIIPRAGVSSQDLLSRAAGVEHFSEHPISRAIRAKNEEQGTKIVDAKVEFFKALPGLGAQAQVGSQFVIVGNERLMRFHQIDLSSLKNAVATEEDRGATAAYTAADGKLLGAITVEDLVRDSARPAVETLKQEKIKCILLTGDKSTTAHSVAAQLGISDVLAEVMPQDKAQTIRQLQSRGFRVAMVGDGINDGPALAQADIGISIQGATDLAVETADAVIMNQDLTRVHDLIRWGRRTVRTIKQNLFWAFVYNTSLIPVAAGALTPLGISLTPELAAAAMGLSSLTVVGNSLLLRRSLRL